MTLLSWIVEISMSQRLKDGRCDIRINKSTSTIWRLEYKILIFSHFHLNHKFLWSLSRTHFHNIETGWWDLYRINTNSNQQTQGYTLSFFCCCCFYIKKYYRVILEIPVNYNSTLLGRCVTQTRAYQQWNTFNHSINHMPSKAWDEITYSFPNFNGAAFEVLELLSYFIPHFIRHVITHQCWDWS